MPLSPTCTPYGKWVLSKLVDLGFETSESSLIARIIHDWIECHKEEHSALGLTSKAFLQERKTKEGDKEDSKQMLIKIISGGQTGADLAGLDAAIYLGLEVGGTIPRGRRTDRGRMLESLFVRYNLKESSSSLYPPRTEQNVRDSDGTVIFGSTISPGSKLTIKLARKHNKPYIVNPSPRALRQWVERCKVSILNVAGNRERTNPGIYKLVYETIVEAFR